jgi:serine/threonine protein kinase
VSARHATTPTPQRVGDYEVLGRCATGGMAEVFEGRRVGAGGFERRVALKRLLPSVRELDDARWALLREARLGGRLWHPNLVSVHEVIETEDGTFLVMDLVRGRTLAELWREDLGRGPWRPAWVAHVVRDAAWGLHAAHELVHDDGASLELVHRDVSPQNLMLDRAGVTRVLDFGVASARDHLSPRSHVVAGKLAYMSPEQLEGGHVDRRTDVFALGVVLYEGTTGGRLFARSRPQETVEAIRRGEVPLPRRRCASYPAELERIVLRALSTDPDGRFGSAEELARALTGVLRELDPDGHTTSQLAHRVGAPSDAPSTSARAVSGRPASHPASHPASRPASQVRSRARKPTRTTQEPPSPTRPSSKPPSTAFVSLTLVLAVLLGALLAHAR